jgi:hypothetical protein
VKHTITATEINSYNQKWETEQDIKYSTPIFASYHSYKALHDEIQKRTLEIPVSKSELIKTILMIHHWGGSTGRYFMINRRGGSFIEQFKANPIQIKIYKEACKQASLSNPDAFNLFCKIKGIGPSFAGKHAYFWSPGKNPLIIIDKYIAHYFDAKNVKELLQKKKSYTKIIEQFNNLKKEYKVKSILVIERGIFQYMKDKKSDKF